MTATYVPRVVAGPRGATGRTKRVRYQEVEGPLEASHDDLASETASSDHRAPDREGLAAFEESRSRVSILVTPAPATAR